MLSNCQRGDVTRKRKLLEKQKAGKKRMKMIGRVEIPQDAFMSVQRIDAERAENRPLPGGVYHAVYPADRG